MAPVHLRLELNSTGSTIKRGREIFSFHSLNIGNVDVECELRIRAKASLFLSLSEMSICLFQLPGESRVSREQRVTCIRVKHLDDFSR